MSSRLLHERSIHIPWALWKLKPATKPKKVRNKREQVDLLELEEGQIRVAEYLTKLPPKQLLAEKLHRAIEIAREKQNDEIHSDDWRFYKSLNFTNKINSSFKENNKFQFHIQD